MHLACTCIIFCASHSNYKKIKKKKEFVTWQIMIGQLDKLQNKWVQPWMHLYIFFRGKIKVLDAPIFLQFMWMSNHNLSSYKLFFFFFFLYILFSWVYHWSERQRDRVTMALNFISILPLL